MKHIRFFTIIIILIICIISSCKKDPELYISSRLIEFDGMSDDSITVRILSNTKWEVTILDDWVTVDPMEGTNNATLIITAEYNPDFFRRGAKIAISGEGIKRADTIFVEQFDGIDVAPFLLDRMFRDTCLVRYDVSPKDGKLSISELNKVQELTVKRMGINSLRGIEYFSRLTYLDCSENLLSILDVSKNKLLRELNCSQNRLTRLDLSNNKELLRVFCGWNSWGPRPDQGLYELNVTGLEKLRDISSYYTKLTTIDVSTNLALETLALSGDQISNLNLSNNINLRHLECNDNFFSVLDISHNTKLSTLSLFRTEKRDENGNKILSGNELKTLNLSANTVLSVLEISGNALSDPNIVKNNTKLLKFTCNRNEFTSLDLSNNIILDELACDKNKLTSLDLSNNLNLERLSCEDNLLNGSINLRNNIKLRYIYLRDNRNLSQILVWKDFCLQLRYNEWYPGYDDSNRPRLPFAKDVTAGWVQEDGIICPPPQ